MKIAALTLAVFLCSASSRAQTVVTNPFRVGWDVSPTATGYKLNVDGVKTDVGNTLASAPLTLANGTHTLTVSAYNGGGESGPSNPLVVALGQPTVDPACVLPLGNRAVSIFITSLQKTGSGGALSKAYLNFQVASPNSPISHMSVRSNGIDMPQGTMDGGPPSYLNAAPGLWFTVPVTPGTYLLSVLATNLYGCTNEVTSTKTVVVK